MDQSYQNRLLSVISGIMDTVQSALIITDLDCNFLLKNRQAEAFVKAIGKDSFTEDMKTIAEGLSANVHKVQQHRTYRINERSTVELDYSVSRIADQSFLVWSLHDRSKQFAAEKEAEINKQKANHAEKMASIGEMSASIVHEIRNPLTIITGQVSLAQEYLNRDKMTKEFSQRLIDRLEKSATRINGIIKSLLNLSRNTGNDAMSSFSLNEILDEVNLFASLKIKGAKVPLSITKLEPDVSVVCHPSEIIQVLINLVKNAKEEVYQDENPWVELSANLQEEQLQIFVTDSGNGIPDDVAKRIFEPYFTTKTIGEGTGIGLSLCKRLIEDVHQGRFYLDRNHPNTRFVIELPRRIDSKQSA
ncbi:sensor histidine kinase [Pseudobacteriovorax antillogorgiicola]|uniref:histidine kinase n=1 Tax=Pseudobacteriovorax antillogorgiicola TaxID=1513793 RepID=A0A1Y6CM08_9BACT|nr:ATP-binding protein [Pseudobacteriovorax antillogorgiicola]TCS44977.1 phospho-acceptor domain-containing protein [Pseudobacteriovorax antillogorgiicola]SMF76749.1 His Kinase A (phospho-acceptor) domain-containing protein [Pseudobacteriovorax antillogorgiicola]